MTTYSRVKCMWTPYPKSLLCQVLCLSVLRKWRYNVFILSRYISWPYYQMNLWLGKWEPISLSPQCGKFEVCRSCGRGDIRFLFCHLTSRNRTIKETSNFLRGSWKADHYVKFDVYRSHGSGDETFPVCLVTSFEHVIKCQMTLREDVLQPKSPICQVSCL